jgi:glycosyltransferase involved in cell wall biosynthesis
VKILFLENWSPPLRGGINSIKTLYEEMEKDHECEFFWMSDRKNPDTDYGKSVRNFSTQYGGSLPLEMMKTGKFLEPVIRRSTWKKIKEFDPDLIITQAECSYLAVKYSQENNCRSCIFLRAWELLYNGEGHEGNSLISKTINKPLKSINSRISRKILKEADILVANSQFTADKYKEFAEEIDPEVVYPFVELENYRVEETGDKILHVNPSKEKGIELTLQVAQKMPEQEFVLAGTIDDQEIQEKVNELENVESLGYVEDMKKAYRQTRIVLMPSKWEEPYGRIPIEAGASGIPTIATNKGGLPESIGNQELLIENAEEAVEKIRTIGQNYERFSDESKENSETKNKKSQVKNFKKLISR